MRSRGRHLNWSGFLLLALAPITLATSPSDHSRSIPIGLFLPTNGSDADLGAEILRGAEIAVDEANSNPSPPGFTYRLAIASSDLPWGKATGELVRLIYGEGATAIVGATNSRAAHLAEQVITRARGRAVLVTPWATEESLTGIGIPWFFRIVPNDRQQAERMVKEIFIARAVRRAALWVEDDPDSLAAARALYRAAPAGAVVWIPARGESDGERLAERVRNGEFEAVILFGSPANAAATAQGLREIVPGSDLFGSLHLSRAGYLDRSDSAVEGTILVAPNQTKPESSGSDPFHEQYRRRHGRDPTPAARYGHDAVVVIIVAIEQAGPESGDRIAEILREISIMGTSGRITFDDHGDRDVEPSLAIVRRGALRPLEPEFSLRDHQEAGR